MPPRRPIDGAICLQITVNSYDADLGWNVDLTEDDEPLNRGIYIKDPLSPDEQATCRWYVEDYLRESPFARAKALEAEDLLISYPEKLLSALRLRESLLPRLFRPYGDQLLYIRVSQDATQCEGKSIHGLFWETLEASGPWTQGLRVVVQRSLATGNIGSVLKNPDNDRPWQTSDGKSRVNVLLVIARDLRHSDGSSYRDASPELAIQAILAAKHRLKAQNSQIQLNLEIVRPGTLQAFRDHMDRAAQRHGRGYFHIVHFDMHGSILKRSGRGKPAKPTGILHFSSPEPYSGKTTPIPIIAVSKVLKRHEIPLVVLNACKSASADNVGEESNMAQQLLECGVRNVVGMPFKIARDSARSFCRSFYYALLLDGHSVAASAAAARREMIMDPERAARYNLRKAVSDYFVAVVYGDEELGFSLKSDTNLFTAPEIVPNTVAKDGHVGHETQRQGLGRVKCVGRGTDLLRVDQMLSQSPTLYLSGVAGVGKTTFLEYAASVWKETRFVEAVISIDFQFQGQLSGEDVSDMIKSQLLSQISRSYHRSRLADLPRPGECSFDSEVIDEAILDVIASINVVIIFEGLDTFFMHPIPGTIQHERAQGAMKMIKSLVRVAGNRTRDHRCYIIFTQRRSSPSHVEKASGHQFGPHCYDLKGLELPDAIEFSINTLQTLDEAGLSEWKHEDTEWLDCLILLAKGIPQALKIFLLLQQRLSIPWRLFYNKLHSGGLFQSVAELKSSCPEILGHFRDFRVFRQESTHLVLSLLGLYWHESVDLGQLLRIFNAVAPDAVKEGLYTCGVESVRIFFGLFYLAVFDCGYIRRGDKEHTLEVHPLFTMMARVSLNDFITLGTRVKLRIMYGASLDDLASVQHLRLCDTPAVHNYLSVMRYCTLEVPLHYWPFNFLQLCGGCGVWQNHPHAVQTTVRNELEHLLRALVRKLPLLDDKEQSITFFCLGISTLSSMANDSVSWETVLELSAMGDSLLLASEADIKEEETRFHLRMVLQSVSTEGLWQLRRPEDVAKSFEQWQTIAKPFTDRNSQLQQLRQRVRDIFSSTSLDDIGPLTEALEDVKSQVVGLAAAGADWLGGLWTLWVGPWLFFDFAMPHPLWWDPPYSTALSLTEFEMAVSDTTKVLESLKLEFFTSTSPLIYGFLIIELADLDAIPRASLAEINSVKEDMTNIENIHNTRDWLAICCAHLRSARAAFDRLLFQDGIQHLALIQTTLETATAPESLSEAVGTCMMYSKLAFYDNLYRIATMPRRTFDIRMHQESLKGNGALAEEPKPTQKGESSSLLSELFQERARWDAVKEWWIWLHNFAGHDAEWVSRLLSHGDKYPEAVVLLGLIYHTASHHQLELVLLQLSALEELCKDSIFTSPSQVYPLPTIRNAIEVGIEQQRLVNEILATVRQDPGVAATITDDLEKMVSSTFCTWINLDVISDLRQAINKHRFVHIKVQLFRAVSSVHVRTLDQQDTHSLRNPSSRRSLDDVIDEFRKAEDRLGFPYSGNEDPSSNCFDTELVEQQYREFIRDLDNGLFAKLSLKAIHRLTGLFLTCLANQAMAKKWWRKALGHWDELLSRIPAASQPDVVTSVAIQRARRRSRFHVLNLSLDEAEATLNFPRCMHLVSQIERVVQPQPFEYGVARVSTMGPGAFSFMRTAYSKRCLSCARWVRRYGEADTAPQSEYVTRTYRRVGSILALRSRNRGRRRRPKTTRRRSKNPVSLTAKQIRRKYQQSKMLLMNMCRHNRKALYRPFGCMHHCRRQYCFLA